MAKEQSEKKEKKEKKESRKSVDGVKKEKSHKKDRKSTGSTIEDAAADVDASMVDATEVGDESVLDVSSTATAIPLGALVPFANPLCDDKTGKKVLKTVKKAAKHKCLKRGVKEVVKAVRKTAPGNPSLAASLPPGIVVLAADISPMDVISHIPVLCEDHNIPYVFLTSRAELGAAGSTKRPTSVVMVTPKSGAKGVEEDAEWPETFKELNKLVLKQGQHVKV